MNKISNYRQTIRSSYLFNAKRRSKNILIVRFVIIMIVSIPSILIFIYLSRKTSCGKSCDVNKVVSELIRYANKTKIWEKSINERLSSDIDHMPSYYKQVTLKSIYETKLLYYTCYYMTGKPNLNIQSDQLKSKTTVNKSFHISDLFQVEINPINSEYRLHIPKTPSQIASIMQLFSSFLTEYSNFIYFLKSPYLVKFDKDFNNQLKLDNKFESTYEYVYPYSKPTLMLAFELCEKNNDNNIWIINFTNCYCLNNDYTNETNNAHAEEQYLYGNSFLLPSIRLPSEIDQFCPPNIDEFLVGLRIITEDYITLSFSIPSWNNNIILSTHIKYFNYLSTSIHRNGDNNKDCKRLAYELMNPIFNILKCFNAKCILIGRNDGCKFHDGIFKFIPVAINDIIPTFTDWTPHVHHNILS